MTEMAQKWRKMTWKWLNLFETDWNDIDLIGLTEMTKKWLNFDWYYIEWLRNNWNDLQMTYKWLTNDWNDLKMTEMTWKWMKWLETDIKLGS